MFDVASGELITQTEEGVNYDLDSLSSVSSDGNRWAYALFNISTETGSLSVFDFETLTKMFEAPQPVERLRALALTPDGSKLLSANWDTVTLWDVDTGEKL